MKIPKLSAPLTKSIRTFEGLLVLGANVVLIVVPIFTHALSAHKATQYGVTLDSIYVGARTALKGVAVFAGVTGLPPEQPVSDATVNAIDTDAAAVANDAVQLVERPQSAVKPDGYTLANPGQALDAMADGAAQGVSDQPPAPAPAQPAASTPQAPGSPGAV